MRHFNCHWLLATRFSFFLYGGMRVSQLQSIDKRILLSFAVISVFFNTLNELLYLSTRFVIFFFEVPIDLFVYIS